MSALRREVEPPRRPYERVSFYLGAASLLFSLLIVVDAASWPAAAGSRQATVERERAATAARLRASRCRAAREAEVARAAREAEVARIRAELDREDVRGELMRQLDPTWAAVDRVDVASGRYGKMNHTNPDAVRLHEKSIERARRATRSNRE